MASPSTPKKTSDIQDVVSPSSKRALDFDFWAERKPKMPRIVEEDLKSFKIEELKVTKRLEGMITLRCSSVFDRKSGGSRLIKLACDDGVNKIIVTAFENAASILGRDSFPVHSMFSISNFEVKKENLNYRTGSYQDLEIIFSEASALKMLPDVSPPSMPYEWKSLLDIKTLPDTSVVDVLAVVAKNWGVTSTSSGKKKLDVSLTDKSMETLRLTLWEEMMGQLVGIETQVVALSRATVSSFQGTKVLSLKWHTNIEVNPSNKDATELAEWFRIQLDSEA